MAVGAADVGATGADVGDGHTNASSLGIFMEFCWRKIGLPEINVRLDVVSGQTFLAKKLGDLTYQYIMYIIQFVKILACVAISVAIRVGVLKQRN